MKQDKQEQELIDALTCDDYRSDGFVDELNTLYEIVFSHTYTDEYDFIPTDVPDKRAWLCIALKSFRLDGYLVLSGRRFVVWVDRIQERKYGVKML